jgi:AcrR family transcriptional regulator
VSEVASRAGVGKGTVDPYLPTKAHLHRVALAASLEQLAGEVERAAESDAPAAAVLREIVVEILRFFWRRAHLLTLVQRYEQRSPRGQSDRRRRVLRAVARMLGRHKRGGNGDGRNLTAAFLLGLARAAILEHGPGDRPETAADRVVDLYLHGIAGGVRRRRAAR